MTGPQVQLMQWLAVKNGWHLVAAVLLIVVALLHLYDALAREGGLYSIGLALAAAGWQVFWVHSESVQRVFGTKGFGF